MFFGLFTTMLCTKQCDIYNEEVLPCAVVRLARGFNGEIEGK